MPEDPNANPTSDPPPGGGSGITDTTGNTSIQGYGTPTEESTTSTTDTATADADLSKVMPEASDPPPGGGSGVV
jgi:hypothetical protein